MEGNTIMATQLASIERRISYHIQGAYANLVEVGRCLIEAKEARLVPHGQWEDWVQRTTGMHERRAQRLMRVAREVPADSAMTKLPISHIQEILALPEGEREAVATKAVEENQSLRALKDEIQGLRRVLKQSEHAEMVAKGQVTRLNAQLAEARGMAEKARSDTDLALTERNAIKTQLEAAKAALKEALEAPAEGISPEAQAEIDRLAAQLADAERMAEHQAAERQKAQKALLDYKSQAARGDTHRDEPTGPRVEAEAVGLAVRTFMGSVGYVPHSRQLAALRDDDRRQMAAQVAMLADWCASMSAALSEETYEVEGA